MINQCEFINDKSFHDFKLNKQSLNENAMVKYIQDTKTLLKNCFRKVPNFIFKIKFRSFYSATPIMTALPVHKIQVFIN